MRCEVSLRMQTLVAYKLVELAYSYSDIRKVPAPRQVATKSGCNARNGGRKRYQAAPRATAWTRLRNANEGGMILVVVHRYVYIYQ